MGKISINSIKSEIAKSGTSKGKFLYFKEGTKARIRFLTDMEDGLEIPFHNSFEQGINVPCQEEFGRECEYCDMEGIRTRNMYIWSVYDYESKEVKLLMFAVNQCSPVPALATMYENYGTLLDRDFTIVQNGKGTSKSFTIIPGDKVKFRIKAKAMSDSAILKCIDKAYPADNSELEEEDEKPKKTKGKAKPEPEETEENSYENMKPQELYKLCKDRDIDCKPKKSKEYYIDLLEEYDEENQEDDWGEDEESEDDEWE